MKIDISNIVNSINKATSKEVELELEQFESRLGTFPVLAKSPVTLNIANQENAAVFINGEIDVTLAIPCGRCLEDVPTNIHFDIDKQLKMIDGELVDDEMEEMNYLII